MLDETWRQQLDTCGLACIPGVVPASLVQRLAAATDVALADESEVFPPGDEQYGRLLFAPAYGGPFIELLELDALFAPFEEVLGPCIVYTMSTSVLAPGEEGPIAQYHRDLPLDRPDGTALAAMVMLDRFVEDNGATEFVIGSHRDVLDGPGVDVRQTARIYGRPGDICVFHPKVRHRSHRNDSTQPRRAIVLGMVKPWMKQRVHVSQYLGDRVMASIGPVAQRRLGLDAEAPQGLDEFLRRRRERPW